MNIDRFKYRAWHKPTKRLFDVWSFTPEYVYEHDEVNGVGVTPTNPARMEDCVLEQCTGLTDKNGRLIYEGDILRSESYPFKSDNEYHYAAEVCFDEESAVFFYYVFRISTKVAGRSHGNNGELNEYDWEVIGNIHDNPELLEEK